MEKNTLTKIRERVAQAQDLKNAVIEYNLTELPKDDHITRTRFYGVPAKFVKEAAPGSVNITYTY